ncbi:MAG TPA: sugar phosphate nucleotidyltransferase [Actinomycetota bacterium]|nr:sugar phosphate nucleotidyltransferase [Actinomycetota bacterium]
MLLAAGLGRRLLPLTWTVPKPALPILGRPIAVEILRRLRRYGVEEAVMNLHHLPGAVRDLLGEENRGCTPVVRFSFEPTILGTGGGIGNAAPLLRGAGPILVHNCDFLSDIDLASVVRAHRASGLLATLVVAPPRRGYARVEVDAAGRILSLAGLPEVDPGRVTARYLFTGCHVIDERVLDLIPADRASSIVSDVYRDLASRGQLGSFVHDGFWWEFGTPEQYLEGSLRLLDLPPEQRFEIASHDPVRKVGGGIAAIGAGATVQEGVRIEGRVALGLASLVGRDASLRDSVVLAETWIGPGSRLERAVVGLDVEIPAGFRARNVLVAGVEGSEGQPATPGVRREGDLLIYDFDTRAQGRE